MIHLLIATPSHSLYGGVERIIESLAAGLPKHGFRVTVGLAMGQRWHLPDRFRQAYPSVDTIDIDGRSGTRAGRLRGLRKALERARPDVVLVARLFDAYEAVSERKLRGDPIRLATTIQAYEAEYIGDLATYDAFVDCCVTSGELIAAAVRRFTHLPSKSVVSIPGGVRAARRVVEHDPSRPIRLGYVGRIEQQQKRALDLVDTLALLRESQLRFTCRVVGAGSDAEKLRGLLEANGLAPFVIFDSWKTTEELYEDVYPGLDVLLHFADWEGITIAPREAMAHGVVPVVSRFLGLRFENHFRDGENALTFAVGDVHAAAACVMRLQGDMELRRRLSVEARRSQAGIWSESGAVTAWANSLRRTVEHPASCGASLPSLGQPASGRLGRWLGEERADRFRELIALRPILPGPGDEWPHCGGLSDRATLDEVVRFGAAADEVASGPHFP